MWFASILGPKLALTSSSEADSTNFYVRIRNRDSPQPVEPLKSNLLKIADSPIVAKFVAYWRRDVKTPAVRTCKGKQHVNGPTAPLTLTESVARAAPHCPLLPQGAKMFGRLLRYHGRDTVKHLTTLKCVPPNATVEVF